MAKLRDFSMTIEIVITVIIAIVLLIWGFLARNSEELIGIRDIFGAVFMVGFIFFIFYVMMRNTKISVLQFYPLLPEGRKIIESIISAVILSAIMISVFNSIPFSFVPIFTFTEKGTQAIEYGITGALIIVLTAALIEETKLMNWLQPTISRILNNYGMNMLFAVFLGIILSSTVFVIGHVVISKKISEDFMVAAFLFSVAFNLLVIIYHAYLPRLVGHIIFSVYSILVLFSLV